jgi:hypothetical protein
VNAAEQAISLETTSKIATIVHLFQTFVPDARSDLKPWANDPETRDSLDPDSIDLGFHLPGWSPRYGCRCFLVQIRFLSDPELEHQRVIGLELSGFNHMGEQWHLSTVGDWPFAGEQCPKPEIQESLRLFCRQIFELFNS